MGKLRITPGFLLLMALLFYLDEGVGMLPWCLLAACLHELGHYGAGYAFGGHLRWLELSAVGAQLSLDHSRPLSYGQELVVVLAGPVTNLLLGVIAAKMKLFLLAGVSFGMGAFNLVPICPLDGGRAVFAGLSALFGEEAAERALDVAAGVLVGLVAGGGAVAVVYFGNFSMMITTVWLLYLTLRKKQKKTGKNSLLFDR